MYNRQKRAEKVFSKVESFIPKNSTILDVGAGDCRVSNLIVERKNAKVIPLDIVDHNETGMDLILYDGKLIPFLDNQFDIVISCFVIHLIGCCAEDQFNHLQELIRVAKKRIIILIDTPKDSIELFRKRVWDLIAYRKIHYKYFKPQEFIDQINNLKTDLIISERFKKFFSFTSNQYTKTLIVLDKQS